MAGAAKDIAPRFAAPPKGEITLVLGAAVAPGADGGKALAAVAELVGEGLPRRRAAEIVARLTGLPRNMLYRGTLS